ncbi:MAG: leucine-rich repeat domain-containing protein, partial [Lachnospiraceae bacterium]|nr:leucine-rich repeat domain-containing protein [Lachnospiraceae bacterium]
MKKIFNTLLAGSILLAMTTVWSGCGKENDPATPISVDDAGSAAKDAQQENGLEIKTQDVKPETNKEADKEASKETNKPEKTPVPDNSNKNDSAPGNTETNKNTPNEKNSEVTPAPHVTTDLEPSYGLKFESNGDGTCKIVGIGVCADKDIVIPTESPAGDTVTSIGKQAFWGLEDVDSITFVNYDYKIEKGAFQYGEFTSINFLGGNPLIGESAFSSCDDLASITFESCNIQADEYAFYSCGKDADITFSNCSGFLDERAFQYGDFLSLSVCNCTLKIDESVFSYCDTFLSIVFADSTIEED